MSLVRAADRMFVNPSIVLSLSVKKKQKTLITRSKEIILITGPSLISFFLFYFHK